MAWCWLHLSLGDERPEALYGTRTIYGPVDALRLTDVGPGRS